MAEDVPASGPGLSIREQRERERFSSSREGCCKKDGKLLLETIYTPIIDQLEPFGMSEDTRSLSYRTQDHQTDRQRATLSPLHGFRFLDWLLTGAYVFRRFTGNADYPICSWLVAHSYAEAGYYFGTDPSAANPDDIWDFVDEKPEYYQRIVELGPMTRFTDS